MFVMHNILIFLETNQLLYQKFIYEHNNFVEDPWSTIDYYYFIVQKWWARFFEP